MYAAIESFVLKELCRNALMNKRKLPATVKDLIQLLPTEVLEQAASVTGVDHQVKKLTGEIMFKLLLMSVLCSERVSLRVMENIFSGYRFKHLTGIENETKTRFTSLSDRLQHIPAAYFEKLLQATHQLLQPYYQSKGKDKYDIQRFDSTFIATSAKLLNHGMTNGPTNRKTKQHRLKQIKFTIGFNGLLTTHAHMYNEQSDISDERPLKNALMACAFDKTSIALFDRGLRRRRTFADLTNNNILFITRTNPTHNYVVLKKHTNVKGIKTASLQLLSDEIVHLKYEGDKQLRIPFRLIKAKSLSTAEELFFITNLMDEQADVVTDIYRARWDIELFFRFLKQELNLNHFSSYNENGLQVMLYVILIAAMLIMVYKHLNKIAGYKIAKLKFIEALDKEIVTQIVLICGGNPRLSPLLTPT